MSSTERAPDVGRRSTHPSLARDPLSRDPLSRYRFSRRAAIHAGVVGLAGLTLPRLAALEAAASASGAPTGRARSVIYIFLSGGLSQIDSFDMKPDGPEKYRGPFRPIPTRTPGIEICEHLPLLAARSERWALCRSVTHPFNEHSQGHMVMLSGRSDLPRSFDLNKPKKTDWPSLASIVGDLAPPRGALPAGVVLPERLVHRTGRVIPGQFGGVMGPHRDPWFVEASLFNARTYGAYPEYEFHHERGAETREGAGFKVPQLALPHHLTEARLRRRMDVQRTIVEQQRALERAAPVRQFRRYHDLALRLLTDSRAQRAFDIASADPALLDRYGRNSFGWSLLMARQLVEAGVRLVQVNLGNNETWDTHVNAFPNLEKFLFPPTDVAVSALLDDLADRGLLDDTLVVMAGEFGRTPRIFSIGKGKPPGRDHWGRVQTVFLAGGGIRGGTVVGSSDPTGGEPDDAPQRPENLAATIFGALGLPRDLHWTEQLGRPHPLYLDEPIPGLL